MNGSNLLFVIILSSIIICMSILESYAVTSSIKINEIEFNPSELNEETQWIEIYNSDNKLIDLSGWLIKSSSSQRTETIPDGLVIESRNYLIVSIPTLSLDYKNESIVLLNPDSVEADRTPILSDTVNDNYTWQRFPNGIDNDADSDWSFRKSTFSVTNGFPDIIHNLIISEPIFVDQKGNKILTSNPGQMVGVKSEIINMLPDEITFAYIIQIKDEENFPIFISWFEHIPLQQNHTIKPVIFWLGEESGDFVVEIFIWRSMDIPEPFTSVKSGLLRITG
ncbi:MAG: lamin tail domain-containing protein [Thaumarchaeota archaeon]|nr:lamin tail domain-containing protein [Nitrososphaerota archaeon]